MSLRRVVNGFLVWLVLLAACGAARASEFHGQVVFNGLPLPGSQVTVTATQGDKKEVAISDDQGGFVFTDLSDGTWHLNIEMTGFAPLKTDITVPTVVTAADAPATAASASAIAAATATAQPLQWQPLRHLLLRPQRQILLLQRRQHLPLQLLRHLRSRRQRPVLLRSQ